MADENGSTITEEDIFGGDDEIQIGESFMIPRGMTLQEAARKIRHRIREIVEPTRFTREYLCRPDDGAYNGMKELEKRFGLVFGRGEEGMFGSLAPEMRRIQISLTESVEIPGGAMEISVLPNTIIEFCDSHFHSDYGGIFQIHVVTPKKNEGLINEFFDAVEERLKNNSIYRGRAIRGVRQPKFIDLEGVSPNQVVHSAETRAKIETTLWATFRLAASMRRDGMPLKRAVLFHGDYGTGKTLTGRATCRVAIDNGWTCIIARPSRDNLLDAMRLARMYMPAMVFVEDVDTETSSGEDNTVKEMLEEFDGITAKGGELVVVMTTNHEERIHRGMWRPGRLDAVIEIGALDCAGMQQLIELYVPASRLGEIDYESVYSKGSKYTPAFIREMVNRAMTAALVRAEGTTDYKVETSDLEFAAETLEDQFHRMSQVQEGQKPPTLGAALRNELHGGKLVDKAGHPELTLSLTSNGAVQTAQ